MEINQNPFLYFSPKTKAEKASRAYFEIEKLKAIKDLVFDQDNQNLEVHRDHFLFQLYIAMYYPDLKELKKNSFKNNQYGYNIADNSIKNSNKFIILLYKFLNASEIIKRYQNQISQDVFTDTISDQKYNEALKELAMLAGISINFANMVGRQINGQLLMGMGVERKFVYR